MIKLQAILLQAQGIWEHVKQVLSNIYAAASIAIASIFSFVFSDWLPFVIVGAFILLDLFWGVVASVKLKNFILSKFLINTIIKVGIYSFAFLGIGLLEKIIHESGFIGLKIACFIAGACELWSMSANMLIVKPNMPFLKIFRMQLKGEIESKIGKNCDDILEEKKEE